MSDATIAEKCNECGGLKAGDLHQFSSCALKVMKNLQDENERLNTRLSVLQSAADHAFHDAALDNEMYAAIVGHKQ